MRLIQPLLIGASYLSVFGGGIRKISASDIISKVTTAENPSCSRGMADCSNPEEYKSGSSSVIFVTTPNEDSAKKIAHGLINNKLAACVNIIPQLTSIYLWEGKVNEDSEILMMIKTRTSRVSDLTKFVRENHPYSVAEVISVPIENGNPPYLDWILKTVPEQSSK